MQPSQIIPLLKKDFSAASQNELDSEPDQLPHIGQPSAGFSNSGFDHLLERVDSES